MSYKQILKASDAEKKERAEKQKKIILDIKDICDINGIEIYPTTGTLLGFVRERKVILHDTDADFYIDYLDYDKFINLESTFNDKGYQITSYGTNCKYKVLYLKPFEDCHFRVDILSFIRDKNHILQLCFRHTRPNIFERLITKNKIYKFLLKYINYVFCYILTYNIKRYVYPYQWFESYIDIKVYGTTFKIMQGYEQFLIAKYGKNWRKPDWNRKYLVERTLLKKHYLLKDFKKFKIWLDRPIPDGVWKDEKLIK